MPIADDLIDDGSEDELSFGPLEGFAAILLSASACDGHLADEEMHCLMTALYRMKLYSQHSAAQIGSMMDRLVAELERCGVDVLIARAVPVVPPELFETAFVNAVDVVFADRVVDEDEKRFIDNLRVKLRVEATRAESIFKVLRAKNMG